MKKVKWQDFKLSPMKYMEGEKEIKVLRGAGCYFLVRHYSPYVEDKGYKIKKKGETKRVVHHRCGLCRSVKYVKYVIPFNMSVAPGWYCYNCRKKRGLLDISVAKRHDKLI
jgi:hypothetical protein